MTKVNTYKGVDIYINPQGDFYCNPSTNTGNYLNKVFSSSKFDSILKSIDSYTGEVQDGEEYYDININTYTPVTTLIKVVRKVGNLLFFDNNTNSMHMLKSRLFPKEVKDNPKLKEIETAIEELQFYRDKMTDLQHKCGEQSKKCRTLFTELRAEIPLVKF